MNMRRATHSDSVGASIDPWKGKHVIISLVIGITVPLGAMVAVLALIRIALRHERERWLSNEAPTRIAAVARAISGLYVHMPQRGPDPDSLADRTNHPGASHDTTPAN